MRLAMTVLLAAGGLLSAAAPVVAQSVGVASAVNQSALGTAPTEKGRSIVLGDKVIHNEQIETDAKGLMQILLADGTSFTVGPNSKLVIDSFVYDPQAGTAKVAATLSKGVFRFIGGKASKTPDGVALDTPVGTVGVRGGIADIVLGGSGGASHIDMRFGDGVTLTEDGKKLGWVFQNGYSIVIGANNQVTIQKTPPEWTSAIQTALTGHAGQNGGAKGGPGTILVAKGLNGNNGLPGGNGTPTGGTGDQPPGVLASDGVRLTTWEEVANSSMANVTANYSGTATGTVTSGETTPYTASGEFALDYSFAEHDGHFSIANIDNHYINADVSADALAGIASFSGAVFGDESAGGPIDETEHGNVAGVFISNGPDIASSVVGTFNADDFIDEDWSITGTFSGGKTIPGG